VELSMATSSSLSAQAAATSAVKEDSLRLSSLESQAPVGPEEDGAHLVVLPQAERVREDWGNPGDDITVILPSVVTSDWTRTTAQGRIYTRTCCAAEWLTQGGLDPNQLGMDCLMTEIHLEENLNTAAGGTDDEDLAVAECKNLHLGYTPDPLRRAPIDGGWWAETPTQDPDSEAGIALSCECGENIQGGFSHLWDLDEEIDAQLNPQRPCQICGQQAANVLVQPCMHCVMCVDCAVQTANAYRQPREPEIHACHLYNEHMSVELRCPSCDSAGTGATIWLIQDWNRRVRDGARHTP